MKNQWPIWIFLVGVIIVVLIAFNYQSERDSMPINQLFPQEEVKQEPTVEYEFVDMAKPEPLAEPESVPAPAVPAGQSAPTQTVPTPSPTTVTSGGVSSASLTIQVLSSNNKDRAEEALKKALAAGYPAQLVTKDLAEKGVWHRIYVGQFSTKAAAEESLLKVKKNYPDAFIITTTK